MKKLLIMLMVVAMASFLFTGCITTPPTEVAVTGVTLNQATMTLTAGGATGTLVETVAPATATNKSVTWSSSAPAVATVSVNGLVTPLTAGTTTITVTTVDGSKTATCAVTVSAEVPTATTVAPIITGIADIVGGYINAARALDGIVVIGTAPTLSEVEVFINGICAGTGDTTATGLWRVDVANADLIKAGLKVDGAKTIHATAKIPGFLVSVSSNIMNCILDTVIPSMVSTVGKAGTAQVYSFVEAADSIGGVPGSNPASAGLFTEVLNCRDTTIDAPLTGGFANYVSIAAGTAPLAAQVGEQILTPFTGIPLTITLLSGVINWRVEVIGFTWADSTTTVRVTNNLGHFQNYTFSNTAQVVSNAWIPGIVVSGPPVAPWFTSAAHTGAYALITTTNTAASAGYVDVTFNEPVQGTSITAVGTTWTLFAATVAVANTQSVRSTTVARLTENLAGTLAAGVVYSVSVYGILDLAGNPIPITAPSLIAGVIIP